MVEMSVVFDKKADEGVTINEIVKAFIHALPFRTVSP